MPCLHSLRSWAMHFTFARLRLAGKMIISTRLRLGQIIFIGALINCLSPNNPLITTIIVFWLRKIMLHLFLCFYLWQSLKNVVKFVNFDAMHNVKWKIPLISCNRKWSNFGRKCQKQVSLRCETVEYKNRKTGSQYWNSNVRLKRNAWRQIGQKGLKKVCLLFVKATSYLMVVLFS